MHAHLFVMEENNVSKTCSLLITFKTEKGALTHNFLRGLSLPHQVELWIIVLEQNPVTCGGQKPISLCAILQLNAYEVLSLDWDS